MNSEKKWFNSSVRLFNILFGLFLLSAMTSGIIFTSFTRTHESNSLRAEIAGQNRMISQRVFILLQMHRDEVGSVEEEVNELLVHHEETLDLLQYGGEIVRLGSGDHTTEPSTGMVLSLVKSSREHFVVYRSLTEQVLNELRGAESSEEEINQLFVQLWNASEQLLESNQAVVAELVEHYRTQIEHVERLTKVVLFANILILLTTIPFVRRPLVHIESVNTKREETFERSKIQQSEILKQSKNLRSQKEAMVNLLEDLELEKEKLRKNQEELYDAQKIGKIGSFVWNLQEPGGSWSDQSYALHNLETKSGQAPFPFQDYQKLVHNDDLDKVKKEMQKALESDDAELTYRLKLPENELRWIRGRSHLERDADGKPLRLKGTFQDVTQEHQIDQAKSEFVSLASHQLRTPLSSINWYTEMLLAGDAGKVSTQQKDFLSEIEASSKRMVELVGALLNVSRLELGTFIVQPKMMQVTKLADIALKELRPMSKKKEQIIEKVYDNDLPEMNIDSKLMSIVFQNLLSNAVKYTPEKGKISLSIKKNKQKLQIIVSDNGMGIPKSQQDKLFSKLFRADNVREQDTEGTGLGLYIVKAILEETGGEIRFVSEENKGTTFYVTMPLSGMKQKEGTRELH